MNTLWGESKSGFLARSCPIPGSARRAAGAGEPGKHHGRSLLRQWQTFRNIENNSELRITQALQDCKPLPADSLSLVLVL